MPRTRASKPSAGSAPATDSTSPAQTCTLPPASTNPPKVFVLPAKASKEALIVSLPNPRLSRPSRFLACPETGLYEFTRIAAPSSAPRSWLIAPAPAEGEKRPFKSNVHVADNGDLFVATRYDPLFLVLPALAGKSGPKAEPPKRRFLSSDDYFDLLPSDASHLNDILRWKRVRELLEERMAAVCDTVEAGETMFQLNEAKLLDVMVKKAQALSDGGLPASLEQKFVRKALEAPLLVRKRTVPLPSLDSSLSDASTPATESTESQSSAVTDTTASSASRASTAATSFSETTPSEEAPGDQVVSAMEASPEVTSLQRLRVAIDYISSSYLPAAVATSLREALSDPKRSPVDFSPLDGYLDKLAGARADAMAARSMGDYSRKRGRGEEEDEARADKKRKLEEEKKRKAMESRGVKELKKVNTSGMKKLSEFFKKK